jgi:hypothetical protein
MTLLAVHTQCDASSHLGPFTNAQSRWIVALRPECHHAWRCGEVAPEVNHPSQIAVMVARSSNKLLDLRCHNDSSHILE